MYVTNQRWRGQRQMISFLFAEPIFSCLEAGVGPATLMNLKCLSSPFPSVKFSDNIWKIIIVNGKTRKSTFNSHS